MDSTKIFEELIQKIYTIQTPSRSINVISYLADIFKQYSKQLSKPHVENCITIIVGGAVADVIHAHSNNLPIKIKDVDIATNMLPDDIEASINWYNTLATDGPKFHLLDSINQNSKVNGTINIYIDEVSVEASMRKLEVTTFRSESGQRGNHTTVPVGPLVPYNDALLIDCQRRDLTIGIGFCVIDTNSLHIFKCKLFGELDNHPTFLEALQNIETGLVKFVGDPHERIYEDGVRMLRFVRKSAKQCHQSYMEHFDICLQFLQGLHEPIDINICGSVMKMKPISKERILHAEDGELIKLLKLDKSKEIIEHIYERAKILKLENLHNFYLPSKLDFKLFDLNSYQNDLIDIKSLLPYVRFASMYLQQMKDNGLKKLSQLSTSIMGENHTIIFYVIAMNNYINTQSTELITSKKQIYQYVVNIDNIMKQYAKLLNCSNLVRVPNKLLKYHDALCLSQKWPQSQYEKFIEIVNQCQSELKEIKKSVYTDKSIDKKDKPGKCKEQTLQLLDSVNKENHLIDNKK